MKRATHVGVKMSAADRARLEASARAEGLTISEYVRRRAVGGPPPAVTPDAPPDGSIALQTYHVDQLGPDALRADNGALAR